MRVDDGCGYEGGEMVLVFGWGLGWSVGGIGIGGLLL